MLRVEGVLIREHWAVRDDLGILTQLGQIETAAPTQPARHVS